MSPKFLSSTPLGAALALAVALLFYAPVQAEVIEAWGEAGETSPFEFEILQAELLKDGNGDPVLKLKYEVINRSEEVVSAVAWGLEVRDGSGEVVAGLGGAFAVDLQAGTSIIHSQTIGGAAAQKASPAGSLTLRAAGGSYSAHGICAGSAQTESEACEQWDFACEALCGANNPLTGGPGVQSSPCGSCTWMYDSQNGCSYLSCQAMCICNQWDWPPMMPAGQGPWAEGPGDLPPGACGEPINPEEGFFFFRN